MLLFHRAESSDVKMRASRICFHSRTVVVVGNVGRITALSSLLSTLVWAPEKSGTRNVITRDASVARQVMTRTARSRRRPDRSFRYQDKSMFGPQSTRVQAPLSKGIDRDPHAWDGWRFMRSPAQCTYHAALAVRSALQGSRTSRGVSLDRIE